LPKAILKKFKKLFYNIHPSGDADKVNLKYTDSGLIKVILLSDKMLDYSSVDFLFTEFPKGLISRFMTTRHQTKVTITMLFI
jgi:hypothetical protein